MIAIIHELVCKEDMPKPMFKFWHQLDALIAKQADVDTELHLPAGEIQLCAQARQRSATHVKGKAELGIT